jgi:hypothetical protein
VEGQLLEQTHIRHLLHHDHRLLGHVHLGEDRLSGQTLLGEEVECSHHDVHDQGPDSLLTHQVQIGLVVEGDLDGAGLGRAQSLGQTNGDLLGVAGSVLIDDQEGGEAGAVFIGFTNALADHAGSDHDHVQISGGLDEAIGDVVARSKVQCCAGMQVGSDIALVDLGSHFVRQQKEHDVSLLGSLSDGISGEAVGVGGVPGFIMDAANDNVLSAGISHVQSLRTALVAVADDRNDFILDRLDVTVLIVINLAHNKCLLNVFKNKRYMT